MNEDRHFNQQAILLDVRLFKETHKVVKFLSEDGQKITAIAFGGARSVKRFEGGLEPSFWVEIEAEKPAKNRDSEQLWYQLKASTLKSSFPHIRRSFWAMDAAMFLLAQFRDLYREEEVGNENIFPSTLSLLNWSHFVSDENSACIFKAYCWSWFSQLSGYGPLIQRFTDVSVSQLNEEYMKSLSDELSLDSRSMLRVYERWTKVSDIPWPFIERSLQQSQ